MAHPNKPPERRVVLGREVVAVSTSAIQDTLYVCSRCVFKPTKHGNDCEPRREHGVKVCEFVVFMTPEDFAAYRLTGQPPVYSQPTD